MNVNGIGSGVPAITQSATSVASSSSTSTLAQENANAMSTSIPSSLTADGQANQDAVSAEHIKSVVKRTNALLEDLRSPMRLEYKVENNQPQVNLVDDKTGQAIRTFPATAFVQFVHREFVGLLMDHYA